jgi:hypothetical protein
MARQVLIVHGWSDTSKSFYALARFLSGKGYKPTVIWLGDYISRDDDVRVEDVGRRMGEVIDEMQKSGQLDPSFDMIVHSTGGLVARAWLTTYYRGRAESCPTKRLLMLAPANYGSKLAATGKSFLGRIVKGYDNWFQTGQSMLNDLELSSPYQWELAQRDVLLAPGGDTTRYYGDDKVWPFVIVGTHPYVNLLRQVVNEDGGDGTVRVCAANLNARGVTIDFSRPIDDPMFFQSWASRLDCEVPLAVLPTRTHGSIIDPDRLDNKEAIAETPAEKDLLGQLILQALDCKDFVAYSDIQKKWDTISEETANRQIAPTADSKAECFHQYLQMNAYVVDNHSKPVTDYVLEFFSDTSKKSEDANVYMLSDVLKDVKKNSQNEALRNLYFDRTDLMQNYYDKLQKSVAATLFMSISAASPGKNIKYFVRDQDGATQQVPVHLEDNSTTQRWLRRNTTHFVQMIIPRRPGADVFKLTKAS